MDRTTLLFSVLLILSVVLTSLFWNFSSLAGIATASYQVQVRRTANPAIVVAFLSDDVLVTDVIVESGMIWYNLTLSKGEYLIKVYDAGSGVYLKQFEIYVAKDIAIAISP